MTISSELVSIIVCPETKAALHLADDTLIEKLNALITKGELRNRGEATISEALEGGLLREDEEFLYPVRNGIPVMLIDEAIPMKDLHDI